MCRICGLFNVGSGESVSASILKKYGGYPSCASGPGRYDEGFFSMGPWAWHRRLSIIDVKAGFQPCNDEDQSIWVVFNGKFITLVN